MPESAATFVGSDLSVAPLGAVGGPRTIPTILATQSCRARMRRLARRKHVRSSRSSNVERPSSFCRHIGAVCLLRLYKLGPKSGLAAIAFLSQVIALLSGWTLMGRGVDYQELSSKDLLRLNRHNRRWKFKKAC
eukprot:754481-Amphidinium_carterae.2